MPNTRRASVAPLRLPVDASVLEGPHQVNQIPFTLVSVVILKSTFIAPSLTCNKTVCFDMSDWGSENNAREELFHSALLKLNSDEFFFVIFPELGR